MDDVEEVNVNLTTSIATVKYQETVLSIDQIIVLVKLGFEATPFAENEEVDGKKELRNLKISLSISAILTAPLLLGMILSRLGVHVTILHQPWLQLLLATPVQFGIGWRFYKQCFLVI